MEKSTNTDNTNTDNTNNNNNNNIKKKEEINENKIIKSIKEIYNKKELEYKDYFLFLI